MQPTSIQKIKQILANVRLIEIKTNRLVTDSLSGAYHSAFKGQGLNFQEVREYLPGDDIRSIDWNVTAKMDKPFIKKFQEERELTLMLLIDLSHSTHFGSTYKSKREIAAEVASTLALSATKNNDKIGLLIFTETIEKFIPPRKGRLHVLRLIREILLFNPTYKKTNIPHVLDHFNKILKRQSISFLVSDFLPSPLYSQDLLLKKLQITNKRHDLIPVLISDPLEYSMPPLPLIHFQDSESQETISVSPLSAFRANRYNQFNQDRLSSFQKNLIQKGLDFIPISTNVPYVTPLSLFFKRRIAERRHAN